MKRNGVDRTEARAGGAGGLRPDHEHPATVRRLPGPRPAFGAGWGSPVWLSPAPFSEACLQGESLLPLYPSSPAPRGKRVHAGGGFLPEALQKLSSGKNPEERLLSVAHLGTCLPPQPARPGPRAWESHIHTGVASPSGVWAGPRPEGTEGMAVRAPAPRSWGKCWEGRASTPPPRRAACQCRWAVSPWAWDRTRGGHVQLGSLEDPHRPSSPPPLPPSPSPRPLPPQPAHRPWGPPPHFLSLTKFISASAPTFLCVFSLSWNTSVSDFSFLIYRRF